MATRTLTHYTGTIRGQNGTLITLLDAVLVTGEGWAKEFSATNRAIYRPPAGSRFRLRVVDDGTITTDGAREALWRGCEVATAINTTTDNFPTTTQVANANCVVRKSNTADATDRDWYAIADDRFICLYIDYSSAGGQADAYMFGDCVPMFSGDNYAVICTPRDTTANPTAGQAMDCQGGTLNSALSSGNLFFARTEDGLVKSIYGSLWNHAGTTVFGNTQTTPGAYPNPRTLDLVMLPAVAASTGSATAGTATGAQAPRAYVPGIFMPLLNNSVRTGLEHLDTFTSTAYDASSQFLFLTGDATPTGLSEFVMAMQTAADWKSPTY
jgi:hypothetical protein